MTEIKTKIPAEMEPAAVGGMVADAKYIIDRVKNKNQTEVNAETDASLADRYTKAETYSKTELNNMITTPNQGYVSVVATDQTTAATDVLPATGEADTIYRVGNWDGTQYDDTVYSEYSWNGSAYVKLSTKSQVGEVYDISANHADTKYADLAAALGTNGANIPQSLRKGGMSVKFVLSSDNKYVQFRLMADEWSTTATDWQGIDDEPTAGSDNLVKGGGVFNAIANIKANYTPASKWTSLTLKQGIQYTVVVKINSAGYYQIAYNYAGTATGATYIAGTASQGAYLTEGTHSFDFVVSSPCGAFQVSLGNGTTSGVDNVFIFVKGWNTVQEVEGLKEDIEDVGGKVEENSDTIEAITEMYESANRHNPSTDVANITLAAAGYEMDSTTNNTSDYIDITGHSGAITTAIYFSTGVSQGCRFCFYDSSKANISNSTIDTSFTDGEVKSITAPNTAKYVRFAFPKVLAKTFIGIISVSNYKWEDYVEPHLQVKSNEEIISSRGGYSSLNARLNALSDSDIVYVDKNGGADFTSILEAMMNTDDNIKVFIKGGTYNLYEEYKTHYGNTFWENYPGYIGESDVFYRGLWMGSGRVLEGDCQTVIKFEITDTISAEALALIKRDFSIIADCAENNALINLTFLGDGNLRYLVHDDFAGYLDHLSKGTMLYDRCIFKGSTNNSALIGGGFGRYNTYVVRNCIFEGNNNEWDAFWHNNNNQYGTDAKNRIFVTDCYGSSKLSFMSIGVSTLMSEAYVSNCRFSEISVSPKEDTTYNISLTKWNCIESN